MPRHPPCALTSLLASLKDARVHCAVLKVRAVPVTISPPSSRPRGARRGTARIRSSRAETPGPSSRIGRRLMRAERCVPAGRRSVPSGPNSVPGGRRPPARSLLTRSSTEAVRSPIPNSQCSTHELDAGRVHRTMHGDRLRRMLLRKEVIQPHLPVRLPCYDFVPIADPTFDSSLHKGWATGFGCYRLS